MKLQEQQLLEKENVNKQKERVLVEKDKQLSEKENTLNKIESKFNEQQKTLNRQESKVNDKDMKLDERVKLIAEREHKVMNGEAKYVKTVELQTYLEKKENALITTETKLKNQEIVIRKKREKHKRRIRKF